MKKLLFMILLLFTVCTPVFAEEAPSLEGEDLFNSTAEEIVSGEFTLNPVELIQRGLKRLFYEITQNRDVLISMIVIAAVSGVLNVMQSSLGDSGVSETAFFACFTLMTAAVVRVFSLTLGYGVEVIHTLSDFITKLSPLFALLLVSSGSVVSASVFNPVLSAAVYVITVVVDNCIVPLVYLGAVLGIVNNISDKVQITKFNTLIRSLAKWILTAVLTIFTSITAIYGFSAPVLDGVKMKAVKFAVGSLVPVVGGLLSDTVETVLSGTQLLKNAAGVAGMVTICSITLIPILKIGVMILMLRLAAAAIEPLTDKRMTDMISDITSSVVTIFAMTVTVAMLFIICIGIIVGATGV